jgi:hypothetical protein
VLRCARHPTRGGVADETSHHRRGAPATIGRTQWQPDAALQAIVAQWPQRFDSSRARALGLLGSASLDALIDDHLESTG